MNFESVFAAFVVGILGAGHCLGMCGGIGAALTFAIKGDAPIRRLAMLLLYNIGRIASYALMGAVAASAMALLPKSVMPYLRIITGILLILMGLYLANVWLVLRYLEHAGQWLWKCIQPVANRLLPVKYYRQALVLGALWGWLPCGLVYTALALAATQANTIDGALVMLAFGLGTLPAVLTGGLAAEAVKRVLQAPKFRILMAALMIAFGLWSMWMPIQHARKHASVSSPIELHFAQIGDHNTVFYSMMNNSRYY